ncbi:MAG TPA: DNA-3-methyladenine glycosylase [Longimicrobiaceae bacterium]|nr:DNA-3-methyladenine glycosylase [Longimicrobiaceae bacterium]
MTETPWSAAPHRARRFVRADALPAAFYARPADVVARELLGRLVVREADGVRCSAEIVETEAYVGPHDEASHAHERFGRTARNTVMFGPPGIAYVYLIYGMHSCLNAVTGGEGFPAAVLLRAARAVDGVEQIRGRRPGRPDRELLRGPGNLCRALDVDRALNGHPLDRAPLWIEAGDPVPDREVMVGPRVGISRAVDWPLRFRVRGSPYVTG